MTNLFIIGNGFDLNHKLKTRYCDFREYLLRLNDGKKGSLLLPEIQMEHHGERYIYKTGIVNFTIALYDTICDKTSSLWSDLEASTLSIDYKYWLNDDDIGVEDNEGDRHYWNTESNYQEVVIGLKNAIPFISKLIEEWINTVDITNVQINPLISSIINSDSLFLTFNYTSVLEKIYNIDSNNICHIHGKCNKQKSHSLDEKIWYPFDIEFNYDIKFGHNNTFNFQFGKDFDYHGISEEVNEIANSLNKKVEENIKNNKCFFDTIKHGNITDIYSLGFSYSEIDRDYILEILKNIDMSKTIWHFDNYDEKRNNEYKSFLITKCGYMGKFSNDDFEI